MILLKKKYKEGKGILLKEIGELEVVNPEKLEYYTRRFSIQIMQAIR